VLTQRLRLEHLPCHNGRLLTAAQAMGQKLKISFMPHLLSLFVSVHRFRVQRSAPPLATEVASLIKKVTLALPSHIRGLGTRTKLNTRSPRKKCWFCHIIAKYHVPDPPVSPVMYGTGISQEVGMGGQVKLPKHFWSLYNIYRILAFFCI
jgi:hypothetical protein